MALRDTNGRIDWWKVTALLTLISGLVGFADPQNALAPETIAEAFVSAVLAFFLFLRSHIAYRIGALFVFFNTLGNVLFFLLIISSLPRLPLDKAAIMLALSIVTVCLNAVYLFSYFMIQKEISASSSVT